MMNPNCEICNDIQWVRIELDVFEEGFGRLVRCECNPGKKIIEPEEPEPIQEEMEFGWESYTNYDD